jgi:hypothetical protein
VLNILTKLPKTCNDNHLATFNFFFLTYLNLAPMKMGKGKAFFVIGREGPGKIGSHMTLWLAASPAGRALPPRKILGTHFC